MTVWISRRASRWLSIVSLLAVFGSASAVRVTSGQGQALIFPIYSTERLDTLMTVTNHTAASKGVFLIVREGDFGAEILSVYAYLAPHDTFRFSISDLVRLGVADLPGIITPLEDQTCTVNQIRHQSSVLPGVTFQTFFPFLTQAFGGSPASASSGYVEVLEVGEIDPAVELRDCDALLARWTSPSGVWTRDPEADVTAPTGGLSGRAWLIDVPAGESYVYQATALDDYRTDPLPGPGGDPINLFNAAQSTRATIRQDGVDRELEFADGSAAVSAALTNAALNVPVVVDQRLAARTDVVLTMPSFFTALVEPLAAGNAPGAPFVRENPRAFIDFEILDQDGALASDCPAAGDAAIDARRMVLQHAVTVIPLGGPEEEGISGIDNTPLLWEAGSGQPYQDVSAGKDGELVLRATDALTTACESLSSVADNHGIDTVNGDAMVRGLPIIATSLTRIRNGTLDGGAVLANYGGAHPASYRSLIETP